MCYNNAAAAQAAGISALRHGILVLLFPPLAMFGGILGLAWKRNRRFHRSARVPTACTQTQGAMPAVLARY